MSRPARKASQMRQSRHPGKPISGQERRPSSAGPPVELGAGRARILEGRHMSRDQAPTPTDGRLDDWLAVLDTYGVQFLILDRQRDRRFLRLARSKPDWIVDFEDRESVLLARVRALEDVGAAT